jgi:protein-S-isoprenylcysteine O-methyltransferase Ste14
MRRRKNNNQAVPSPQEQEQRGRVRITEAHYQSPASQELLINPNLYTHSSWRITVSLITFIGALIKLWVTSDSTFSLAFRTASPSFVDLPFFITAFVAGMSLSYWVLLPFPAHVLWSEPHLPFERSFIKYQYQLNWFTRFFGVVVFLIGVSGTIWSACSLGTNWSPYSTAPSDKIEWISTGPYSYIRHPMYFCSCIIAIGLSCASGNAVLSLSWIAMAFTLLLRGFSEDAYIKEHIAQHQYDMYDEWKRNTNMFLPKVDLFSRNR